MLTEIYIWLKMTLTDIYIYIWLNMLLTERVKCRVEDIKKSVLKNFKKNTVLTKNLYRKILFFLQYIFENKKLCFFGIVSPHHTLYKKVSW